MTTGRPTTVKTKQCQRSREATAAAVVECIDDMPMVLAKMVASYAVHYVKFDDILKELRARDEVPNYIACYPCWPRHQNPEHCWQCMTAASHENDQSRAEQRLVQEELRRRKIGWKRMTQPSWCTSKRWTKPAHY
jgi:hypothetical protein